MQHRDRERAEGPSALACTVVEKERGLKGLFISVGAAVAGSGVSSK